MTAAELLANLTGQGFRLVARDDGIGVKPGSRLTEAQIRAIRNHKAELLALLRAGVPSKAPKARQRKKQTKAQKRVAEPKAGARPNENRGQPAASSKGALPAQEEPNEEKPELRKPSAADSVHTERRAEVPTAWTSLCPMCQLPPPGFPTCLRCNGVAELESARRTRSKALARLPVDGIPNSPLCPTCSSLGYASCADCLLAHDPTLVRDDSMIRHVRARTAEESSWTWRRCEVCFDPFQGPRFGIPNMCPTCRAGPAICSLCGGRDRAHLQVCRRYIQDTTPLACGRCGYPLASGACRRCSKS
jgi:hypothetical protein